MIFIPIEKISTKTEKEFFIEKVELYIRLVEVFCEKNGISFPLSDYTYENENLLCALTEIGVIATQDGLLSLKRALGEVYPKFINAVLFVKNNEQAVNPIFDKLSNKKRKELQKDFSNRPLKLVDFFCGAGGLSLGLFRKDIMLYWLMT